MNIDVQQNYIDTVMVGTPVMVGTDFKQTKECQSSNSTYMKGINYTSPILNFTLTNITRIKTELLYAYLYLLYTR